MRRIAAAVSVCLAAALTPAARSAGRPIHGNVVLILEGGLSRGGDYRADVEFELAVRDGKWPEGGWGHGLWFSRGHHKAAITASRIDGETIHLTLDVKVFGDYWVNGGRAKYEIVVKNRPGRLAGTYTGSFTQNGPKGLNFPAPGEPAPRFPDPSVKDAPAVAVKGKVAGRIDPPWPRLVKGHVPFKPSEHPRLIFRKSDVPLMRKRAEETPEGRAIMRRAEAVLGSRGPSEADKFTTWPAVGYGFAYQMTGDEKYAEKARKIVDATIFKNPAGRRGRGISQDIHHGPRLQGLALAFDLCCEAWEKAYRLRCIDEIRMRARELMAGQFEGRRMRGLNLGWWSNHNAIRVGCAALGAIAVQGEKNSHGQTIDFTEELEVCARELRGHYRYGLGKSGYCMEGSFYKVMTMQRGSVHAVHAFERALGWKVLADLGDFDLVGYFMEAEPGRSPKLAPVVWAVAIAGVPDDMMPGVRWLHARTVGLKGDGSFGVGHGLLAPYAMATYPFDVPESPPSESLRWAAPDENKGHFIIRPTCKDRDDIVMVLNLKSESLRASWAAARAGPQMHVLLRGFGRKWLDGRYLVKPSLLAAAVNEHHGATITSYRPLEDRAFVIDMNLDRAYLREVKAPGQVRPEEFGAKRVVHLPYWSRPLLDFGVRGERSMAVDCTHKSGCPLLVAVVDRITVPASAARPKAEKRRPTADEKELASLLKSMGVKRPPAGGGSDQPTAWHLPISRDAGKLKIDAGRFVIGEPDGPTLAGVLVTPGKLAPTSVSAKGEGTYFVVFTLQGGRSPRFDVTGEGLGATVKVGRRTIRFEKGTLVLQ